MESGVDIVVMKWCVTGDHGEICVWFLCRAGMVCSGELRDISDVWCSCEVEYSVTYLRFK